MEQIDEAEKEKEKQEEEVISPELLQLRAMVESLIPMDKYERMSMLMRVPDNQKDPELMVKLQTDEGLKELVRDINKSMAEYS